MTRAPRRRLVAAGVFAAAGAALACGLGVWQLHRLAWKEDLLARLEAGRVAAPIPAPPASAWPSLETSALDYRRVAARGVFDPRQALVFAGPVSTPTGPVSGYFVMGVLTAPDGGRLLVHRGVVPLAMRDAVPAPPAGEVSIVGLARAPERAGWFTPADDAAKASYFLRDPKALAPALGAGLSPFYIDEEKPAGEAEGWPRKGVGTLAPPNNHLSYAFTWFGLAATLLAVFAAFAFQTRRKA